MQKTKWFAAAEDPSIFFEDTPVGRLKKAVWDASPAEIDAILDDYAIPSPSELGQPGTYIQNTPREDVVEKRRKNDIVLVPLGCTENHGMHANSGLDTFNSTMIAEGVRRHTAKHGWEVNLAFPPLNYGGHPYHHIGMPGTVIMPDEVVRETLVYTMAGLWNDGFRKIIFINNHGQTWNIEGAIQDFCKRYQLPGIYRLVEWHRAVREFFVPVERPDSLETHFVHADEAETSVGLLMFGDMIKMSAVKDAWGESFLPDGWIDRSCDTLRRGATWAQSQGHNAIELKSTPGGVVGTPSISTAAKGKRPIAAVLKYLTLLCREILDAYPAGTVPDPEKFTMRTRAELEPFLKEPLSPGWKPIDALPRLGLYEKL